jgi:hypothetical protein
MMKNMLYLWVSLLALTWGADAAERTQTLQLNVGWNAVWLEVAPVDVDGAALSVSNVFTSGDCEIDIVALPVEAVGTAEFIVDQSSLFNQPGWAVWRRDPASGQSDLFPVAGNQAYLVHVSKSGVLDGDAAGQLVITGDVVFFTPDWVSGSYNLLGFGVSGTPTFDEFFAGSLLVNGTVGPEQIFRLDSQSGRWEAVNGETDTMRADEACWMLWPLSAASTRYAGPVSMLFSGSRRLNFGPGPGSIEVDDPQGNPGDTLLLTRQELTFGNLDESAHPVTIRKLDPDTAGSGASADELRLYALEPQPESLAWQLAPSGQVTEWSLTNLTGKSGLTVTLGGHRNWSSGDPGRENLYRIEVGLGSGTNFCYHWLPVAAQNAELPTGALGSADALYAGLWVGEVSLNAVTSITEPGNPIRPTTSVAPLQVLIHVDTNGVASLLKHVMLMQTKTVDESIAPDQVLVVDEARIPFFEGIEERDGKRVGRRLETVAYDMPRQMDPVTQADLLDEVAAAFGLTNLNDVAQSNIVTYVDSRQSRPPELAEDYHLSWPLEGGLGPHCIVRTAAGAPLTMDPFHRGNPFRHAFHPRHGAGYAVTRDMEITFDDTDETGLLRGTYRETLTDLVAVPLCMEGRIILQRVSTVGSLE